MNENKLNFGSGKDYRKGWTNLDLTGKCDIQHDVNIFPYPFEDNTFDIILCSHILEHTIEPLKVVKELHRILKPESELIVKLPIGDFTIDHHRGIHTKDYFHALTRTDGVGNDCNPIFELVYQKRRLKNIFSLWYRFKKWALNLVSDEWEYRLMKVKDDKK